MLEVNHWIMINSITYKINAIEDMDEMRLSIMKQLNYIIDFKSSSFYIIENNSSKEIGRPIGINYPINDMEEYIKIFKEVDYSKGLMATGKNIAYRESDILNDELRVQTEYYKNVYKTHNWHYSLHLNICYKEEFLGVMSFFREVGKEDFKYDDIFILDMVKDHLALRLYKEKYRSERDMLTLEDCVEKFKLTEREVGILSLILKGKQNEEICEKNFITSNTLKKHILNIYRKMGVNKRVQLLSMIRD